MRKLRLFVASALVCGALVGGCGSGGGTDFATIQQALADCSHESLANFIVALFGLVAVPDVIQGDSPPFGLDINAELSIDPLDPPNTWDFSVVYDTNGNAIKDSAIVGKATFSADPTDGIESGDTIHFVFSVQNSPIVAGAVENGTVTGSGDILATVGNPTEQATISGDVSLVDTAGAGCTADLTIPPGTPLNLDFGSAPAQLAANNGFVEFFGPIDAILETLGHTLDATLTLTEGSQTANVTGDIDGTAVDFDFDVLPPDAVIVQMFDCAIDGVDITQDLGDLFGTLVDALVSGTPPAGVLLIPTANPNVFNYTIDLAVFAPGTFNGGTLTGQATLIFPVASLAIIAPNQISCTWQLTNALRNGRTYNGQSTASRPLVVRLAGGSAVSFSGAGTMASTPTLAGLNPDCQYTIDIPTTSPLTATQDSGFVIITVTVGEDVATAVFDFAEEEVVLTINGIPVQFIF